MIGGGTLRKGLIAGTIALTAIIYLLPKTPVAGEKEQGPVAGGNVRTDFSMDAYITDSKSHLDAQASAAVSSWEDLMKEQADAGILDSLAMTWDRQKNPGIAAWYFEKKATLSKAESDWLNASYRYFDAFKNPGDSLQASFFASQAIHAYEQVIALNPKNLNAKTDLGLLYTEATPQPMKGITLLREVVAEDPAHENAQLNLGFLSMKSGQFDKAVERFNKVLEINPGRIEMYLYLGEAYLRMGDKEQALEQFNRFRSLSNDTEMIHEVDAYIEKIKSAA